MSEKIFSKTCSIFVFQHFEIATHLFQKRFGISLELCGVVGVSKVDNNWVWESWSRPLGPKIMRIMTFRILGKRSLKVTSPK